MRESLKPIEAGCLALVLLDGSVVTVVRKGSSPELRHRIGMKCERCRSESQDWVIRCDKRGVGNACECALVRIDPDADMRDELRADRVTDRTEEIEGRRDAWIAELAERVRKLC